MDQLIDTLDRIIPPIVAERGGFKSFTEDELQTMMEPIRHALSMIDVKELLHLSEFDDENAVSTGSGDRVRYQPIHNHIMPIDEGMVRYLHIIEFEEMYSVGIFVFAPNAKIPLHNHPEMTVLSRVLYGKIHARTLDIVDSSQCKKHSLTKEDPHGFTARLLQLPKKLLDKMHKSEHLPQNYLCCIENDEFDIEAPQVTELYPKRGNLHEFTAGKEGACVLDVLVPPYNSNSDRDCTYYEKWDSFGSFIQDGVIKCVVRPIDQPEWFHCIGGSYSGLKTTYDDRG